MSYVRAAALFGVLGFTIFAAGCGHGSSGATPPLAIDQQTIQDQQNPALNDGQLSSSSTDTTLSTTTGGVRTHVMTAGLFWGYGGTSTSVPLSAAHTYLTWAMTSRSYAATLRSGGVKVVSYLNFWRNYTSDYPIVGYDDLKPGGLHAAAEAKTCSGTVIKDPTYGGGYETDARKSSALGHALVVIGTQGAVDAIMADDTGALGGISLPCNFSLSTYQAAVNKLDSLIPYKMWVNTLGAGSSPVNQVGYALASNVLGAMCELCITENTSSGDRVIVNTQWIGTENAEIKMIQNHKIFWLYGRASGPATEYGVRKYAIGSFLLAYDPNYAMLQEAFKTPSGFEVFPESGLVPMNPLTTASSVSGYLKSNGTYMREFGACYYHGTLKSRCAVVVNPTSYSKSLPTSAYAHQMNLSGYGVWDGGTVSFTGSRPSSLPAGSAAILFP